MSKRSFILFSLAFIVVASLMTEMATAGYGESPPADGAPTPVEAAESARVALIERVSPSVVCVFDDDQSGGGSGVLIDPRGFGLTNYHVVAGMLDGRKGWGGLSDGSLYRLEVLGIDPTGDVAMFRLVGRDSFPFARLGDSDKVAVGDTVLAMGNPFTLSENYAPTVTRGLVTGVHRYQWGVKGNLIYSDCFQTDASINPGNSGGPLFNSQGEIIGINGRISVNTRGRFNVGFGYAIAANQIKRFIPALRAGLLAKHGTLQAIAEWDETGATIFRRVSRDGSAHQAGIRIGDRLVRIDEVTITSPNHFASVLGTYPEHWRLRIGIERGGKLLEFVTRLDPVTPKLRTPFVVDEEVNLKQVERVISALHRHENGAARTATPMRWSWRVNRSYAPDANGSVKPNERFRATQAGDGPVRMRHFYDDDRPGRLIEYDDRNAVQRLQDSEDTFDLPADVAMVYAALYLVQKRLTSPPEALDLTGILHAGADAAVHASREQSASVRDVPCTEIFEIVEWPVAQHAVARLAVDVPAGRVAFIDVRDIPSGSEATILLSDYREIGGVRRPCSIKVEGPGFSWRDTLTDWGFGP